MKLFCVTKNAYTDYHPIQNTTKYKIYYNLIEVPYVITNYFKDNYLIAFLLNLKHKLQCFTSFFIINNSPATLQVYNKIPRWLKPPFMKCYKYISTIKSFICIWYIVHLFIKLHSCQTLLEHDLVKIPNTTSTICKWKMLWSKA